MVRSRVHFAQSVTGRDDGALPAWRNCRFYSMKYLKGLDAQSVVMFDTSAVYMFNGQWFIA